MWVGVCGCVCVCVWLCVCVCVCACVGMWGCACVSVCGRVCVRLFALTISKTRVWFCATGAMLFVLDITGLCLGITPYSRCFDLAFSFQGCLFYPSDPSYE